MKMAKMDISKGMEFRCTADVSTLDPKTYEPTPRFVVGQLVNVVAVQKITETVTVIVVDDDTDKSAVIYIHEDLASDESELTIFMTHFHESFESVDE